MASQLVKIQKFENGDFEEFIDNFEICSLANEWTENKKALLLGACLKGEALEVYKP